MLILSNDLTLELQARVRDAAERGAALRLLGHGTKSFLGPAGEGEALWLGAHSGIINYQPKELVLTARSGTPLAEIESVLAEQGQQLPFEPPHFQPDPRGPQATLGGTIACGLSGPARPYAGAARDLVLGTRILNGRGALLRFGGEVMKNVAGYDVSRLMTGAFGTLGVLLDISLKVLPRPAATCTLILRCGMHEALERMNGFGARPLPISATCWEGEQLWVRLSGNLTGVAAAAASIGGDRLSDADALMFWRDGIREQQHAFFGGPGPLWRLSMPPTTPPLALPGPQLIEWSGAQRWLRGEASPALIRSVVASYGGHATLFRGGDGSVEPFHPLPSGVRSLHRALKHAFDPQGILNPGRLYPDL